MALLYKFDAAVTEQNILAVTVVIDAVESQHFLVQFEFERFVVILRDVFEKGAQI